MTLSQIEGKIHEIADALFQHIAKESLDDSKNLGLYSGKSGIVLFLSNYLNKYPNSKFTNTYRTYLDSLLEELTCEPQVTISYCSGLVGAFEALKMMNKSSLTEIDFSDIEAAYDNHMLSWMNYCFVNENYDFLHGALGVAMYFKNNPKYIENTLLWLKKTAIKDGNKFKWVSSLGQDRPQGYNICLSHGISSIIIYLTQVYSSGVITELNKQLLEGAVNYVLSQEIDHNQYGCYFPSQSLDNGEPIYQSRLAWCYGDLGVAVALWQAGKVTKKESLQNKALEVYKFSANRTDIEEAMIRDAGLCHGTASVAMMFSYMYRETIEDLFKKTRDYWIAQTLNMSQFPDGPAGYKQFTLGDDKQPKWEDNYILLEGISGIGLMLLSLLDTEAEKNLFNSFALFS